MKSAVLVFWLVLLGLLGVTYGSWRMWQAYHKDDAPAAADHATSPALVRTGLLKTPGGTLADFTLIDTTDKPYRLQDSRGEVRAISFFFMGCPSICLQLNNTLAKLQKDISGDDVQFISITCDPTNDTPAQLSHYARRFAADPTKWVFLTGGMKTIEAVGKSLEVVVAREMHSDRVVLIDREGRIRGNFRATEPDQLAQLKDALAKLTAEAAPSAQAAPAVAEPANGK